MARELGRNNFYYRATVRGGPFDGPFAFCTTGEAFTIVGDDNCAARGYEETRFRKVETGNVARFTLNLVPPGGARPEPAPEPEPAPRPVPQPAPPPPTRLEVYGSLPPGTMGEPFSQSGQFTGCDEVDGLEFCGFEADGWRWHAYYGNPNDWLLEELQRWPAPIPVSFAGDIVTYGDITVEIVLNEVIEQPGDTLQTFRDGLQGLWQSADDPASVFRIAGAEAVDYYDGAVIGRQLVQVVPHCEGMEGLGAGLLRTELETQDPWCVLIDQVSRDSLTLVNPGRGNLLTYYRLE
jgi:hypothetical protein